MVKNIVKKLFLVFGLIMFVIGIRSFNNINYAVLVVLGMISIVLGWKYPPQNKKV